MEWKPNPKQELALQETCYEVGFGGARGGGKTETGIVLPLYHTKHNLFRALVIRKNADDLRDWADRANRFYSSFGAKMTGQTPSFEFPSGAVVRTGHLKDANAYMKYQGHEYQLMIIEELTQIPTEENYLKLIASCRSTISELRPQVFSTFNPDGPGFSWVKNRFGLHGIPTEPVYSTDPMSGLKRAFIPSKLEDNPYLLKDGQYKAFLNGLPDGLRQAWRDGSWDEPIIQGAFYTLELAQAQRENRIKLVPYDAKLKVHTVWDLGIDDSMSVGFWQRTSQETRCILYYENNGFGLDHYSAKLQEFQREFKFIYGKHFAPHDANKRELGTGKTIIQTAETLGIHFDKVPMVSFNDGIQKVRLMFPRIYFNNVYAQQFIDAIRNYRRDYDEKLLKYKDDPVHDWSSHASDMLRYTALVEDQMNNEDKIAKYEQAPYQPMSEFEGVDLPMKRF